MNQILNDKNIKQVKFTVASVAAWQRTENESAKKEKRKPVSLINQFPILKIFTKKIFESSEKSSPNKDIVSEFLEEIRKNKDFKEIIKNNLTSFIP